MDVSLFTGLAIGAIAGFVCGWALATGRQASFIARARAAEEELAYTRLAAAGVQAAGELERRRQAVEHLVAPLRETLGRLEAQLREVEIGRRESHAMLAKQVDFV